MASGKQIDRMNISHLAASLAGQPGRIVIRSGLFVIDLMTFSLLALRDWYRKNAIFKSGSYASTVAQIIFTGVDALPTLTVLGLATGFIFVFRLISIIDTLGDTSDITELLVSAICLGLAPFLSAIIIISRTGSAIVVDLGNMKLHGEIEALEHLGININNFLIAPRIIATAISQVAVTVYFTVIALGFGILLSGYLISPSHYDLLLLVSQAFSPYSISLFLVKTLIFGFVIGTVACFNGLRVHVSATEVPQRTTAAIVQTLIIIFVIDGLLAMAFFS